MPLTTLGAGLAASSLTDLETDRVKRLGLPNRHGAGGGGQDLGGVGRHGFVSLNSGSGVNDFGPHLASPYSVW